jgi:hypothetical protein
MKPTAPPTANAALGWLSAHRCFHLVAALVLLLALLPAFEDSDRGKLAFAGATLAVLLAALGILARSRRRFWAGVVMAVPAFAALLVAHSTGSDASLTASWLLTAAVFLVTLVHLAAYVLRPSLPGEATSDRIFGGIAAYLLLGFLWSYFAALLERAAPGSFSGFGPSRTLHVSDFVVSSFDTLTTIGTTGIVPQLKGARVLMMLETLTGTLYLASFIARLVSLYARARD